MPVIKNFKCEEMPKWSQLRKVERFTIRNDEIKTISTGYSKAAVFSFNGFVAVTTNGKKIELKSGKSPRDCAVLESGKFDITTYSIHGFWMDRCEFYVFSGNWDWAIIASFRVDRVDKPFNIGDPIDYHYNTNFDNHYHDYDEYWLVVRGSGVVQSEGILYDVAPGDLIATKRGTHHQFAIADSWVKCIGFKVRMGGEGRMGFLWEHTHGKPTIED